MKINTDNRTVHKFNPVDDFGEGRRDKLATLYSLNSPDVNQFLEMLSSVVSKISWVPSNGKWRCAVIFDVQGRQVAIFFPLISLSEKGKLIGTVDIGTRGNVATEEIENFSQKICAVFEQKVYS